MSIIESLIVVLVVYTIMIFIVKVIYAHKMKKVGNDIKNLFGKENE